jgi:glycosyltransferase involved in cell wall biosynthesis
MDIAVIVSTFQRPEHLRRCLASLEVQEDVDGRFEVVVADDGSRDETLRLVASTARQVAFPLTFTTHDHDGFRLARCRNEGAAASTAPYLLFTDGDCILPRDHLRHHLAMRHRGLVVGGDCIRLDAETSFRIDVDAIHGGDVTRFVPRAEAWRIRLKGLRAKAYEWTRVPMRPRLCGNNIALWRDDFERVNGFDEGFVGWGLEDRDLQCRLERLGLRVRSILLATAPIHLWHPTPPSFARNSVGTPNLAYFRAIRERPTFCVDGLVKPWACDVVGRPMHATSARKAA